jgi:hypothetical protein
MFNGFEDAHSGDIVCGNLGPQVKRQEERLARASRIQIFNVRLQNKLPHDFHRRQWRDFPEYVLRVDGKAPRQVGARLKQIEESVVRYMSQLDTADRRAAAGGDPSETVLLPRRG